MTVPVPLALTLAGGSLIIAGVLIAGFFIFVFSWYTRRGSGINQHPYGDIDHASGPEKPSELAHDITQEVRNWDRGVGTQHRPARTLGPEQLDDQQLREALRAWRMGGGAASLTKLDAFTPARGLDSGAEVIVFWDYLAPDTPALAAALADLSKARPIREAALQLPVADARPLSFPASLAVEAGRAQGAFWAVHDSFLARPPTDQQDVLAAARFAQDEDQFRSHVEARAGREQIIKNIDLARASGVHSVPAVFIGGVPYEGEHDAAELAAALDSPTARPWERRIPPSSELSDVSER